MDRVRVAAVQASPVILDADATLEKAVGLIADAAARGARLAVFPECFMSFYPQEHWDRRVSSGICSRELRGRAGSPCRQARRRRRASDIHVVIGVNEREPERSGSVYNTMLILGPDGLLLRHRKLMPTFHERTWHAFGAGDDLDVVALPFGRVGGLTCWENRMPLARYAVYRSHPQSGWRRPRTARPAGTRRLAPSPSNWAHFVSVRWFEPHAAFPSDFRSSCPPRTSMDAAVFEPSEGRAIAGPVHGAEAILVADCDLRVGSREKRVFDVVGHYAREEVLLPLLIGGPTPEARR